MAVNQEIKIKFTVDDSELEGAKKSTVDLGNAVEVDKKKYKELADVIQQEVAAELKAAGVVAGQFSQKVTDGTKTAGAGIKSLRQELQQAKQAAIEAGAKFGESSKEFAAAAKRAGELKAQLGDLNQTLDALDPDAKAKAFSQVGQAAFGAFQVATGALQAFGVESEKVNKLAQQFQGLLNISAGISQLGQLGDALKNVSTVLGFTTTAQKAATAATELDATAKLADAAATDVATVSTKAFTAALITSPLVLFAAAAGAIAGAIYLVDEANEEAIESSLRLQKSFADAAANNRLYYSRLNELIDENTNKVQFQIDLGKAQGLDQEKLIQLEIKKQRIIDLTLAQAIESGRLEDDEFKEAVQRRTQAGQQIQILEAELTNTVKKESKARIEERKKESDVIAAPVLGGLTTNLTELAVASDKLLDGIEVKGREVYLNLEEDARTWADRNSAIIDAALQTYGAFAASFTEITRNNSEERIAIEEEEYQRSKEGLDTLLDDKRISQKQYDDSLRAIEKKREDDIKKLQIEQAKREKALSIFDIALNTAVAITKTIAQLGLPAATPFIISTAAIGAAQLAAAASQPIPRFAKGTLSVPGGQEGTDSVHAMLMPGEAVIPTRVNRKYKEPIKAIFHESVGADELTQFIQMTPNMRYALLMAAGEQFNESIVNKPTNISTAQIMNSYITQAVRGGTVSSGSGRGTSVNVDMSGVERSIRNNKTVRLDNTKQLAQQIAASITDTINVRRKW